MKKRTIKMIGLDLDGTVFNEKKEITPHTRDVLAEAIRRGIVVLPATGRPQAGLPQQFLEIPGVRYALTANGSRILDLEKKETVYESLIPWKTALELIRLMAGRPGSAWEAYYNGKCFVDRDTYRFLDGPGMTPAVKEYIHKTRNFWPDLISYMEENRISVEKLHMVFEDTKERDHMLTLLKQDPRIDASFATSFNLEVISASSGKGNGLLALGKILGIRQEEIMACGDSWNDWDMLKKAGLSVVMENGDEETKKLADFITKSNEEDGVAWAIEQLVL